MRMNPEFVQQLPCLSSILSSNRINAGEHPKRPQGYVAEIADRQSDHVKRSGREGLFGKPRRRHQSIVCPHGWRRGHSSCLIEPL